MVDDNSATRTSQRIKLGLPGVRVLKRSFSSTLINTENNLWAVKQADGDKPEMLMTVNLTSDVSRIS